MGIVKKPLCPILAFFTFVKNFLFSSPLFSYYVLIDFSRGRVGRENIWFEVMTYGPSALLWNPWVFAFHTQISILSGLSQFGDCFLLWRFTCMIFTYYSRINTSRTESDIIGRIHNIISSRWTADPDLQAQLPLYDPLESPSGLTLFWIYFECDIYLSETYRLSEEVKALLTMACSSASTVASGEKEKKEQRLIDVMFLCDEWKSSKGGLSTFNRELAIKRVSL